MPNFLRQIFLGAILSFRFNGVIKGFKIGFAARFWRTSIIRSLFSKKLHPSSLKNKTGEKFPIDYSVVIPSNNGISRGLKQLIDSIRSQTSPPREFIIVDSGSTDETVKWCRQQPDIKLMQIEPSSFSHSHSRNVGLDACNSEWVLFTVDDAVFEDRRWVERGIQALTTNRAISVSGRQVPTKDADIYAKSKNLSHLEALQAKGVFLSRTNWLVRAMRHRAPFWSQFPSIGIDDTNHLAKTSVLQEVRFEGDSCEDLFLAVRLTKHGFKTIFNCQLEVVHSHSYSLGGLRDYARRVYLDNLELKKINHFPLRSLPPVLVIGSALDALQDILASHSVRYTNLELLAFSEARSAFIDSYVNSSHGAPTSGIKGDGALTAWIASSFASRLRLLNKDEHSSYDIALLAAHLCAHMCSSLLANAESPEDDQVWLNHLNWKISEWR
jgi:glycosyltransferase involved in cell wall biosynthesis